MGRAGGEGCGTIAVGETSDGKRPMQRNDLSRSLVAFDQTSTVVAVVELSLKDRLDTEALMRAFLGWLRGEARHCRMAAIPTLEQEDAKRPTREHESLVAERTRLVNRMKATLVRLGITGFNVKLRKAAERLAALRTPEGEPVPPNTPAELGRCLERLRAGKGEIPAVWAARGERPEAFSAPRKKRK